MFFNFQPKTKPTFSTILGWGSQGLMWALDHLFPNLPKIFFIVVGIISGVLIFWTSCWWVIIFIKWFDEKRNKERGRSMPWIIGGFILALVGVGMIYYGFGREREYGLGINSKQSTPEITSPSTIAPQIIVQSPPIGNLKQRAITLSKEIINDQNIFGNSDPMPTLEADRMKWLERKSGYFKWRFFEKIRDIRNEFAQLHLRDEDLDSFIKNHDMLENANKEMAKMQFLRQKLYPNEKQQDQQHNIFLRPEIRQVSERLKALANQIKND